MLSICHSSLDKSVVGMHVDNPQGNFMLNYSSSKADWFLILEEDLKKTKTLEKIKKREKKMTWNLNE